MWSPLSGTLRDRRVALVVLGSTFLAVCAVYVVVVLGGGLLIGHTDSPQVGLSILATAIVALGLEPLRSWLEGVAKRWVQGDRATPYDVLSRFTESLTGEIEPDHDELPLRMARLLAEGTGARWAEVWLMVAGEPELAAAWPQEAGSRQDRADGDQPGLRSLDVLGLISASVEFYLGFTYYFGPPCKIAGEATITIEVHVLFFSASVHASLRREFGDPKISFQDLIDSQGVWTEYCDAFAA